ncbi:MAG: hypothetical protein KA796_01905 [Chryseobacterium sp.]|nr:hypothetical protein [Chryseobacterium sp.]MBP7498602.1 hypothetical protein [Chryseobacterium sp.]
MKYLIQKILVVGTLLASLCACGQTVPYAVAKNYFVKNTYPEKDFHILRITTQTQFDEIFGMATVMGKDGAPTPIDFQKNFVIALIDNVSNTTEEIVIESLKENNSKLTVLYDLSSRSQPSSASFRYFKILIVDKKFEGPVYANPAPKNGMQIVGGDMDEKGCKPSTGYSWSVLENDCVAPWNSNYFLNWDTLRTGIYFSKDNKKAEILWTNPRNIILTKKNTKVNSWEDETYLLVKEKDGSYTLKDKKSKKAIAKGGLRK